MPDPVREIRYRMTEQDWTEWGRLAMAGWPTARKADAWSWYVFDWASYAFALLVWAYLSAELATLVLPPAWWNATFLAAFLAVAGATAWRDNRLGGSGWRVSDFQASHFSRHESVVRLVETGIDARIGGVAVRVAWDSIVAVQRASTLALVAYDLRGSGILVPYRAFADEAAMDAFLGEIEAHQPPGDASGV